LCPKINPHIISDYIISEKTTTEMVEPSGRGLKDDESAKLEREV
jgi:hypothetical protein